MSEPGVTGPFSGGMDAADHHRLLRSLPLHDLVMMTTAAAREIALRLAGPWALETLAPMDVGAGADWQALVGEVTEPAEETEAADGSGAQDTESGRTAGEQRLSDHIHEYEIRRVEERTLD